MKANHILQDFGVLSDAAVIGQVLSGKPALFEILIRRYNPVLYKTGRAYGFNHQDTEDLMQETYIQAYQHLGQFENRSTLKTWLIRIMLNQCFHKVHKSSYQKEKIIPVDTDLPAAMMALSNNSNDTALSLIKKELNNIIEASLDKLPANYRLTFTLRELLGLSVAQTAEVMKTTQANVKVRLNRAKKMLRSEIEKSYSPEDIYEFNLVYCDRVVAAVMKQIALLPDVR